MVRHLENDVYICTGVTLGLATAFTVLRFIARRMTKVALWWDDWFLILAYVSALAWTAIVLPWAMEAGLGRSLTTIKLSPDEAMTQSRLYLYAAELAYAFSLAFSKMSILGMYWRLFSTSSIRLPIQILFVLSTIWLAIRTFMAIFHCVPVHAFWDHSVEGARCDINDSQFFFGTVLAHLLIDLVILVLPVVQVHQLHLRVGQKVGVIGLFMFGILVCIASVVVLVESMKFDPYSKEMPLEITPIIIWATVEINFAIVSACLPMMRPLARRLLPGSVWASDPSSYHKSGTRARDHSNAIKLRTVTRTAEIGGGGDDASSTRNLTDVEMASPSPRDEASLAENHHKKNNRHNMRIGAATRTVVQGTAPSVGEHDFDPARHGGIHVKNETSVSYERI